MRKPDGRRAKGKFQDVRVSNIPTALMNDLRKILVSRGSTVGEWWIQQATREVEESKRVAG